MHPLLGIIQKFRLRDCYIHIGVGFEVAYLYVSRQVRRPEEWDKLQYGSHAFLFIVGNFSLNFL